MQRQEEAFGGTMSGWNPFLQELSRAGVVSLALVIVLVVGVADYFTGSEIFFSIFYLVAVALTAWFAGKRSGVLIAVASVATWLAGDLAAGAHYATPLVPVWNAAISLAFYLVVVWLAASLSSLHRELEARVRQRTLALTQEMAERERLEKELLETSEREQRRIGHDLHDSLGQHLTGTALAGQVLEEKLAMQSLPEAADASRVVALVEESIELTRSLARGLHPVTLEDAGLKPAFEELAATIEERFQVACRCECAREIFIRDIAVATHLYRIAQESISNGIKHGRARQILLRLERSDGGVTLTVQDDGRGLPPDWSQSPGLGLRTMAHRATMIGATFSIGPGPEGGTRVVCALPLANP
jgi:signal transduction histidine kinase